MNIKSSVLNIEFDDIIYSLQNFGGISEYWTEVTARISSRTDCVVSRCKSGKFGRFLSPGSNSNIFHSSYFRTSRTNGVRNVVTVYDMAYELGYLGSSLKSNFHIREHKRAYFNSDALICISNHTYQNLIQIYPDLVNRCQIAIIPLGVNPAKGLPVSPPSNFKNLPFFLYVGGRGAYKNFYTALKAFEKSKMHLSGFNLICTGNKFDDAEREFIKKLDLEKNVINFGNASRIELAGLYSKALALVYPSKFEGFGLPILEAMSYGCPVVVSNSSCLPEVAGDSALYFNPDDYCELASKLLEVIGSPIQNKLKILGKNHVEKFSWERTANAHIEVYKGLL